MENKDIVIINELIDTLYAVDGKATRIKGVNIELLLEFQGEIKRSIKKLQKILKKDTSNA